MRTSKWLSALSLAVALLCMALFTGCAQGRAQLLAAAAHADRVNNAESMSESRSLISMSAKTFSAQLLEKAAAAFSEEGREDFVLSPAAVYSALATVAACAGGETRRALTDAMETTYDDLQSGFPLYFRSLAGTDMGEEFDFGNLTLVNSIWLQDGTHVRDAGLKTLSESFFCHSYAADFQTDGRAANEAVRAFIAKQTNRLIDLDPNLPPRRCLRSFRRFSSETRGICSGISFISRRRRLRSGIRASAPASWRGDICAAGSRREIPIATTIRLPITDTA